MKKFFILIATALMAVGANADDQVIASWIAGEAVGTWTALGTAVIADYTSKYNANSTTTACMTFGNSYTKADDGTPSNCVRVDGDFKKGDIVTFQPFTVMNNADFTGGSKFANIEIRDVDSKALFNTNGTADAKTVTDGHEQEGDPKEFTYTLASDLSAIYFGRTGGTRINIMKIVITRGEGGSQGTDEPAREMSGTVVKDSKTWLCPQEMDKDAELSGTDANGVVEQDGLYLRGKTGSHSVKVAVETVETTIAGEAISVKRVFSTPSNGNLAPAANESADAAIKNATDMSLALNVGAKGKLYVYLRPKNITATGRYVWIYKNGEKVLEKLGTEWTTRTYTPEGGEEKTEAAYELHEFDVDAAGATFFIGAHAGGVNVAAVKFVADNGSSTAISQVKSVEHADGKWHNLAGQQVAQPTKGIFIRNGKKVMVK